MPINALGVDFSKWDGAVNFDQFQASGASFCFFKVGEGRGYDEQFFTSAQTAADRGLTWGGFWYYNNQVPPLIQASLLFGACKGRNIPMGLAWDFEDRNAGPYSGWRNLAVAIQRAMDLMPDQKFLIYTSPSFWAEKGPSRYWNYPSWRWFGKLPLWIAHYGSLTKPTVPGPWADWLIWQFTPKGNGAIYGSRAAGVDLNWFNGDTAALAAYAGPGASVPPPPLGFHGTVVSKTGLRVRAQPTITAPQIGALPYYQRIEADTQNVVSASEIWLHLTFPMTGWAAQKYGGTVLITLV